MMRIAIIDTDLDNMRSLDKQIAKYGKARGLSIECTCITDIQEFVDTFNCWQYDIVLLRMELSDEVSGMSGMTVASELRSRDSKFMLVFMAEDDRYMLEAFSVHAYAYLLKSEPEKISKVLDDIGRLIPSTRVLDINSKHQKCKIFYNDILYAQMDGHYAVVTDIRRQQWRTRTTFTKLKEALNPEEGFESINKGLLVNLMHVEKIYKDDCIMKNGIKLLVQVRRRTEIQRMWDNYSKKCQAIG